MLPREHGAYGQLLFPLIVSLSVGRPRWAASALAVAAVAAFLGHEPLLVLLGQRGMRAARERGAEAWRWFLLWAVVAIASGMAGLLWMPDAARVTLVVPAVLAATVGGFIAAHREHTTAGEILSALALATLATPVALSAGATMPVALTCALVFGAVFVSATVCVRAVILVAKRQAGTATRVRAVAIVVVLLIALAVLSRFGVTSPVAPWAALPVCGVAVALAVAVPSPRHLKAVGWTLVGATVVTALTLIAGLRLMR